MKIRIHHGHSYKHAEIYQHQQHTYLSNWLLKRLFYWVAYPLEASPRSLNSMTESHFFAWTRVTRSDDTVTQIIITLKTRSHSGGVLECEWRLVWWILSIRSVKMLTKLVVIMTLIVAYIRTCFHTVMHKYLLQYIHIYYICTLTRTRIYIYTHNTFMKYGVS